MINSHHKLIRDYLPQFISKSENNLQIKPISDQEYPQALRLKLIEEAKEVANAVNQENLLEEIADLYEVIDTIIDYHNLNREEIITKQKEKRKQKGGFKQGLQLIYQENKKLFLKKIDLEEQELLTDVEIYLKKVVAPKANLIDTEPNTLKEALKGIAKKSLLTLKVPKNWGGKEISDLGFHHFQMLLATYSGALAFLQIQHQSAAAFISSSKNELLKKQYLFKMATGEILIGAGFSHLRRKGKPSMTAIPHQGGYQLTGFVPWITGYDLFSKVIIGATLPNGEELYVITPFQNTQQNGGGKIEFSQPLNLMAMNSTNTVTAEFLQWFISEDEIVSIQPINNIQQKDQQKVLDKSFFNLGCASAALEILSNNGQKKQLNFIEDIYRSLKQELTKVHHEILMAMTESNYSFAQKLQLRSKAINFTYRCASAAVMSSSGAANQQHHSAARVYREALLYSVFGQTTAAMQSSLTLGGFGGL